MNRTQRTSTEPKVHYTAKFPLLVLYIELRTVKSYSLVWNEDHKMGHEEHKRQIEYGTSNRFI